MHPLALRRRLGFGHPKAQAPYNIIKLSFRSKWQQPQRNQKIGDVVISNDTNLPPGKWPLGRVVDLHPGKDGHVRVVTIKTKNGTIQRPVVKLSTLPIRNQEIPPQQNKQSNLSETTSKIFKPKFSSCIKTMFITLLTLMLILPAQCSYNIAQLKDNQAIYFDQISNMLLARVEWKLIVYFDMKPYWEGSDILTKYLYNIEKLCKICKQPLCEVIITQFEHGYNELDHYNHLLLGQQFNDDATKRSRAKRSLINGIGNIAHSLFGVLDDQFAEQYKKDIELLRLNQKHIATLWKNQTSIVEVEHNLLQRIESTMDKQHKVINQHINKLDRITNNSSEKIQDIMNSNEFTLSAIIINNMLLNLKTIQEYLLDTIADLHYGTFNVHLITPEHLRNELNIISGQLSRELSLPINNMMGDLPKLYHLLKVKAKVTKEYFIFEIRIPLVTRDYYEIYNLIPIQQGNKSSMISIKPIADYIALNIQKDSYLPMTQADIQKCRQFDEYTYLCMLRTPIYHMTSDKSLCVRSDVTSHCVIINDSCKASWLELHEVNTYLFSCC
ncbi:unnamed protein product [Euphydryas editha]|uniref:DUF5641 domain-containing protein n=1 Tax=Euphydryas editha TaxID=104508 RepID=A0AAU9VFP2_EUPED|nr:unnamed protein product [Euphydryas editha]